MSEDDLKLVLSTYQQKSFELFNQNIVLETQVNSLNKKIEMLTKEIDILKAKQKKSQAKIETDSFS